MKLEKLLAQQSALAVQISELRKAEALAKKAALVAQAQAKKAAILLAAEKAGLFNFDSDLLASAFQKIAESMKGAQSTTSARNAQPTLQNDEQGE